MRSQLKCVLAFASAWSLGACSSSAPTARPTAVVRVPDAPEEPEAEVSEGGEMAIAGLESSITEQEARAALQPRMQELAGCFALRSGSLQQLGGRIRLVIRVDGGGHVVSAHADMSTVGDREVERCVNRIVHATRFGGTRGGGEAQVQWSFSVDPPPSVREPLIVDPERVAGLVRRRARTVVQACNAPSGVSVTAYVSRSGRVLSAGAAAQSAMADEVLDCVAQRVKRWRMPANARVSKVTFNLT